MREAKAAAKGAAPFALAFEPIERYAWIMNRLVGATNNGAHAKTAATGNKSKRGRKAPTAVVIARPASPERTEKLFGFSRKRSKHVKDLVEKVTG